MSRICILGAHSAVARALIECLEEREIEVEVRRATTSAHLQGDHEIISQDIIAWADLVVLAFPGDRDSALTLAQMARQLGKPVLDMTETLAHDTRARYIFPGIHADAGLSFDPMVFSVLPIGLGGPLVSVLRALVPFEPTRATIATYESTASLDQPGMDELALQVRSRFGLQDIEPQVFGSPIAFGSIPLVGAPGDSPFDRDELLRFAIESGLENHLPDVDLSVTRALVPTFSADSAVIIVDVAKDAERPAVESQLKEARGLRYLGAELPSSFEAIGRDDALVGRLSVETGRIGVWIASDRLRKGSATMGALAIERWFAGKRGLA